MKSRHGRRRRCSFRRAGGVNPPVWSRTGGLTPPARRISALSQARNQAFLDAVADVVLAEINVPDGPREIWVVDGDVAFADHLATQTDAGLMRQINVVALGETDFTHHLDQAVHFLIEIGRGVILANGNEEGLGNVAAGYVALHDQVQLFGLIERGQLLGGVYGRTVEDVAADGVDVEKELLPQGRSGEH